MTRNNKDEELIQQALDGLCPKEELYVSICMCQSVHDLALWIVQQFVYVKYSTLPLVTAYHLDTCTLTWCFHACFQN